jgi:hypothetical protein
VANALISLIGEGPIQVDQHYSDSSWIEHTDAAWREHFRLDQPLPRHVANALIFLIGEGPILALLELNRLVHFS